jgi:hypothetical protein
MRKISFFILYKNDKASNFMENKCLRPRILLAVHYTSAQESKYYKGTVLSCRITETKFAICITKKMNLKTR